MRGTNLDCLHVCVCIWEFPKIRGTLSWGPYNKGPIIQGTINSHILKLKPKLRLEPQFHFAAGSVLSWPAQGARADCGLPVPASALHEVVWDSLSFAP